MTTANQDDVQGALDFARLGFDTIASLAEETTLEITDMSYAALRMVGVWTVVLTPIQKTQRGATKLVFRGVRLGGRVVTGIAGIGYRIVR